MADNPGPFTFKGTMSYIVGRGKVAIVDPGPADERHIGALLEAVRNETVTARRSFLRRRYPQELYARTA
jgi:glyoxylase-like metal-dependent hydrolase (beta-lactamase superfamily II)